MTPVAVTAPSVEPGGNSPRLEYNLHVFDSGTVLVRVIVSPTLYYYGDSLRHAVSFDDQTPEVVALHTDRTTQAWGRWVSDNVIRTTTFHTLDEPGAHVLKYWMVDPGLVLQRIVVETGDVAATYLGPPESARLDE